MAYDEYARPRTWMTRVKDVVIAALILATVSGGVLGARAGLAAYAASTEAHKEAQMAFAALYQPAVNEKGEALQAKDASGKVVTVRVIDLLLRRVAQDIAALPTSPPPPK